jgi:uncharacterized protein
LLYVDTSATVKLLLQEPESAALIAFLRAARTPLVCSRVGIVELRRVGRRSGADANRSDAVAATLVVVELDETIEHAALSVDPALRTLDAIHLATALAAAGSVTGFVCYDARLAAAAKSIGLTTFAPV